MARAKFQTLTEQMFYILLCLRQECCGMDIMERVREMTEGRVNVGPGTLYNLLDQFSQAEMIVETKVEGRRKSYILTEAGKKAPRAENERVCGQAAEYPRYMEGQGKEQGGG